jgi:hypothetical protein
MFMINVRQESSILSQKIKKGKYFKNYNIDPPMAQLMAITLRKAKLLALEDTAASKVSQPRWKQRLMYPRR